MACPKTIEFVWMIDGKMTSDMESNMTEQIQSCNECSEKARLTQNYFDGKTGLIIHSEESNCPSDVTIVHAIRLEATSIDDKYLDVEHINLFDPWDGATFVDEIKGASDQKKILYTLRVKVNLVGFIEIEVSYQVREKDYCNVYTETYKLEKKTARWIHFASAWKVKYGESGDSVDLSLNPTRVWDIVMPKFREKFANNEAERPLE